MTDWGRKIPTILRSDELLDKAFGRASRATVRGTRGLEISKRLAQAKVSGSGDIIQSTLLKYIHAFPDLKRRDGFLPALMEVLVDVNQLRRSLGALHWCVKKCGELQRIYLRRIRKANTQSDVERARREFYGRVSSIVYQIDTDLRFISECREKFRQLPDIDSSLPTVVIAGFPNVGKSQLVGRLSTAEPRIAAYPFTTKGIGIGHFQHGWRTYQVIDTPGLLDRPLEERNPIERQAIVALEYLADLIVFLLDPSETSGYPMGNQLSLLESIKKWLAGVPVVEVENKSDIYKSNSERIKISALTGEGVDGLMETIISLLNSEETRVRELPDRSDGDEDAESRMQ